MSQRRVQIGLIGTGRIGQVHAASIAASPDAELCMVADRFVDAAQATADRFGGLATETPEQILASRDVEAVVVATPTPTHVDMITACLDAGLPVLCEKPIDLDISRVDTLRSQVAASSTPVALGFNQRFDPAIAEVRSRVAAGEIGALEQLSIVSRDPGPPPADYIGVSGGIFRDMTIHDFDMARFFLGDVVEVSAFGAQLFDSGARNHGDFDSATVILRAASGGIATITNSRHSVIGYDQRLEAFGSKGMLQVANAPSSLVRVFTASVVEGKAPYIEPFLERYASAYARELAEFVRLVRGEGSTIPGYEDGRAALLIADAAQRSAEQGTSIHITA